MHAKKSWGDPFQQQLFKILKCYSVQAIVNCCSDDDYDVPLKTCSSKGLKHFSEIMDEEPMVKALYYDTAIEGYAKMMESEGDVFGAPISSQLKLIDNVNQKIVSIIIFDNGVKISQTEHNKIIKIRNQKITKYISNIFPEKIEESKKGAHIKIALLDRFGKDMPEKKRIYITLHYNIEGMLQDMTYPLPLLFAEQEDGENIGYIDIDDEIYIVPILQEDFNMIRTNMIINRYSMKNILRMADIYRFSADKDSVFRHGRCI